jgi:hypothetical protein
VTEKDAPDPVTAQHGAPPTESVPPALAMDGIRIATLAMLGVHTIAVIVLSVFLVTNVQSQRQVNECYQQATDQIISWANAAVPAARSDRQAQRELLLNNLSGGDPRAAIERYLAKLDEADRERSISPFPTQRCAR